MRNFLLVVICSVALVSCTGGKGDMYSQLGASAHPRLFASKEEFTELKEKVQKGDNEILNVYHANLMKMADEKGLKTEPLSYKLDASGKRILPVSRDALARIFSAAYAWRFTGDKKYLHQAEKNLNAVCDFKDWNPSHYLDCAEMACAVAIGYDWLYQGIKDSTRVKIRSALKEKAFDTSLDSTFNWWYDKDINWCQVCNAGLSVAALAVYEYYPDECRAIIEKAVLTDSRAAAAIYAPDGAYSEGPVYWNYGTMFQTMLQAAFESTLGTDFGLSETPGLSRTGDFVNAMIGNSGQLFNYADNLPKRIAFLPLWYLSWRYDRPELAYTEADFLPQGADRESERLLPLYIIYAARLDPSRVKPMEETFYSGTSASIPVVATRTGWGPNDLYLGTKGGFASSNHGHMDAGAFVFDAFGVRWAGDPSRQEYEQLENPCKELGGDFWDMSQRSVRWEFFRFNNFQHNTLTVNGKLHNVDGLVTMTAVFRDSTKSGAAFDLTPLFNGDVESARREVYIKDSNSLAVDDSIVGGDAPALVRWTIVGEGRPKLEKDGSGIRLTAGGKVMKLSASGTPVEYKIWPSSPAECGYLTSHFDEPIDQYVCGVEFKVPAGKQVAVHTSLVRVK